MKRITPSSLLLSLALALPLAIAPVSAQDGPPAPGAGAPVPSTAPAPGGSAPAPSGSGLAPLPGPSAQQVLVGANNAGYRLLPLSYHNAAIRLEELRNIMLTARPREFQDAITDYLNWLGEMADSHWRIYLSFCKIDSMKAQADVEKQTTIKLGSLKRQSMLLKAEFLIRNNRQPEALQPLVEIVVAEPRTATGEAAYSLLKQIGFTDEVQLSPSGSSPSSSINNKVKPIG